MLLVPTFFISTYQWMSKLSMSCHEGSAEKSICGLQMVLSFWHNGEWLVNHDTARTLPYYH